MVSASVSDETGFYVLFAVAVTVSVQLVGLYLVFATLMCAVGLAWYLAHGRTLRFREARATG